MNSRVKIQLCHRIVITAIILLTAMITQAQKCQELVIYRDTKLFDEYDKTYSKYKINQQAKDKIVKIKNELLSDTRWATSDAGLTTGIIAKNIATTCNLIADLMKFNPALGIATSRVTGAGLTALKVYQLIQAGQSIKKLVTDGGEKSAYAMMLSYGGPLGQAVKMAWDLGEGIKQMAEMPEDRQELKAEVKHALDAINSELEKYNRAVSESTRRLTEINEIKNGIDNYIRTYCGSATYKGSGNSNITTYSNGRGCTWSMQNINSIITFVIDKSENVVTDGHVSNDEIEKTLSGTCISGTRFKDHYNQASGGINGNVVTISFVPQPVNHQKCNVEFKGTISGNSIVGMITWRRIDAPSLPSIQYTVTMDVTLVK